MMSFIAFQAHCCVLPDLTPRELGSKPLLIQYSLLAVFLEAAGLQHLIRTTVIEINKTEINNRIKTFIYSGSPIMDIDLCLTVHHQ